MWKNIYQAWRALLFYGVLQTRLLFIVDPAPAKAGESGKLEGAGGAPKNGEGGGLRDTPDASTTPPSRSAVSAIPAAPVKPVVKRGRYAHLFD